LDSRSIFFEAAEDPKLPFTFTGLRTERAANQSARRRLYRFTVLPWYGAALNP